MQAKITIHMDNAAFENPGLELAQILRDLANKVENSDFADEYDRNLSLRDMNGNTVGQLKVTGRRD